METRFRFCLVALAFAIALNAAGAPAVVEALETAFTKGQWNQAAELGYEILAQDPNNSAIRVRTAFALFKKGYPNAALQVLKKLSPADWQNLIKKQDKLVEIAALFQKKVPFTVSPTRLDQLNPETASEAIRDEIRFAKGRVAFEKKDVPAAKVQLQGISRSSRFYGPASYLLGTMAMRQGEFPIAAIKFVPRAPSFGRTSAVIFTRRAELPSAFRWAATLFRRPRGSSISRSLP
jgi:hypothetical protein